MSIGGQVKAGAAYVELLLQDEKFTKGLKLAQRDFRNVGSELQNIAGPMLKLGGSILAPLGLAVKAASDLEETMNKFNVVFGNSAKEVQAWGDNFADEVGRSKKQIADFMAGTADLLIPLGFQPGAATEFSKQITGLTLDLASFNNMADEDVLRDLHAALTGSGEVMKKYGVIVSEAAVKQELLNQGIDPKNVTEQQKVQARMNIIMRGTTAAQGDAIRSGGGFANTVKRITGNVMDAAAGLGTALLPLVTQYANQIAGIVKEAGEWVKSHQELILIVAKLAAGVFAVGTALAATGLVMTQVSAGIGALVSAFNALNAASLFLLANPAVLALVAIATAAIAAGVAMDKLTGYTAQLSNVMGEKLAAGDKQRSQDQEAIKRLQELADKQKLTNDEIAEAKRLTDNLTGRYGDLGITVDETTGKISGMAGAMQALTSAMREQAAAQVDAKIEENIRNYRELEKEAEAANGFWQNLTRFNSGGAAAQDAIGEKMRQLQAEQHELQKRRKAILGGNTEALTGPKPEADANQAAMTAAQNLAKAREDAADAAKQLAKIEEQEAAKRRSRLEQEIHDIEAVAAERQKLLDLMIEGEKSRDGGPRSSAISILEARKRAAQEDAEAQIEDAKATHANEQAKADEEAQQRKADFERMQQDEIANLEIDANDKLSEKEKQLAKLELERNREKADAKAQGFDTKSIDDKYNLRKELLNRDTTGDNAKPEIFGTFTAAAAQAQGNGNSPMNKMVSALDKQIDKTSELVKLAEEQKRISQKTSDAIMRWGVVA